MYTGKHMQLNTANALILQILDKESLVNSGMVTKIKQEIRILKQLRHPNVVELKEVLASRQQIFMVMELVPGGELFDKIIAEGPMSVSITAPVLSQNKLFSNGSRHMACCMTKPSCKELDISHHTYAVQLMYNLWSMCLQESDGRRVLQQLLDGLDHCHQQGIFHRSAVTTSDIAWQKPWWLQQMHICDDCRTLFMIIMLKYILVINMCSYRGSSIDAHCSKHAIPAAMCLMAIQSIVMCWWRGLNSDQICCYCFLSLLL